MENPKTFGKRILSFALALLLVLSLAPVPTLPVVAADELEVEIDTDETVTLQDTDSDDFYEISSADKLYAFAALVNGGNTRINAILTADIVVNTGTPDANSRQWTPIGPDYSTSYQGTFNGAGHTISGLYLDDENKSYVGLFGCVGVNGTVQNVGIIDSYFNGYRYVGGVVGQNYGTVANCYNTGTVSGSANVGGVVGYITSRGTVTNCYNTGKVTGTSDDIGGVVGSNYGAVTNCYNMGTVSGKSCVGGVVGYNYRGGSVTNCYYLATETSPGGIAGKDVEGLAEAKTEAEFASGEVAYLLQGQQEEEVWGQKLGNDAFPILGGPKVYCAEEHYSNYEPALLNNGVYEIDNAGKLYWFAEQVNWYGHTDWNAILTDNIVVNADTLDKTTTEAKVWTPIGNSTYQYQGIFDGNGHTISGLYVNDPHQSDVGFFGCVGLDGTVQNVGIINSSFTGSWYVGGVVAYSYHGTVENCYNRGTVSGSQWVGGVVGENYYGTVTNCYNTGTVSGSSYVGGVVGYNYDGTVENCYNEGDVSGGEGSYDVGGVVGSNFGEVTHCYNTGTVSGDSDFGSVVGCNYEEDGGSVTNCYYLTGTCTSGGIGGGSGTGSAEAKTKEEFASGAVTWLLNEENSDGVWGQNLGTDDSPVLGGPKVYYGYPDDCRVENQGYSNEELLGEKKDHIYESAVTPPTCTEQGYTTYTCDTCGDSYVDNWVDALGHSYDDNGFCTNCDSGYQPAVLNKDGVYEIDNAGKLYWFAEQVNSGNRSINAILTADIVVNEGELRESSRQWTPIGTNGNSYQGTFNGNGHTISGLYVNVTTSYVGLFGYVFKGTVQKVGIINSYFKGYSYVGGVVGNNSSDGTVTNCYNTGTVSGSGGYVGGVVGYNFGTVENCYNTGKVDGSGVVGGVVGKNLGNLTNCYYYRTDTCTSGIGFNGGSGSAEEKTKEEFASGAVTWLLNGQQAEGVWGQTLGTDDSPVLGDPKVYYGYKTNDCDAEMSYSNDTLSDSKKDHSYKSVVTPPTCGKDGYTTYTCDTCGHSYTEAIPATGEHNYDNGFCTKDGCGAYEPAEKNTEGYYEIDNAGKLYWFAEQVNSGNTNWNAILTADIVVNEGELREGSRPWTPIGTNGKPYRGTFNGNGHTISGLYVDTPNQDYVGFFGYVGSGGTVQNVGIIDSYFNGRNYVGGVVGFNYGTVENCYNTGTVSGSYYVGGVVGENDRGTVENCYNRGTVSGSSTVGGVVGYNTSNGTVTNCYNTGAVSGTDYNIGGVVGENDSGTVENCYNTGTVTGTQYVGGVVGYNTGGTVTNCYNEGDVSGSSYVGGVVGRNYAGTVTNCYNTGDVIGTNFDIGGVVGSNKGEVTNCYNTGKVTGKSNFGSVVGCNYEDDGVIVTNCYYLDTETSPGGIGGGSGTGSAEAKYKEDFESGAVTWLLNKENSDGVWKQTLLTDPYPTFRGATVYQVKRCDTGEYAYSNTNKTLGHFYGEDGKCENCKESKPELNAESVTLSLKDEVQYNIYCTIDNTGDVEEMGLEILSSGGAGATILQRLSNAVYDSKYSKYKVHTPGIPAKKLGDNVYFRVYAKLTDGTYVYSQLQGYDAVQYAQTILSDPKCTDDVLKSLMVAMLNYGAAAQVQFGYKTESLMNKDLTDDQKAMVDDYDAETMITPLPNVDATKAGDFGSKNGFSGATATISLGGAFAINYYFTPSEAFDGNMTLYYWTQAQYEKVDKLTAENASGSLTMVATANGVYRGSVTDISAKQIDEPVYVVGVYTSDGKQYTTGVIAYSVGAYCKWAAQNASTNLQDLAEATAVYGHYAKTYFGK